MPDTTASQLLVIAAKAPLPGTVKTRLLTKLTPREATDLYCCFLRDRIKEIRLLKDVDLAIAYTPVESKNDITRFISNDFQLFIQQGEDLGERMHRIFVQTLGLGYQAVIIIGCDTPDLPRSMITQACQWLAAGSADAVFGPSRDGGYYLVGLREPRIELFSDISWSTAEVLTKSLQSAEALNLSVKLLPQWSDLDTFEDLLGYYRKYSEGGHREHLVGQETFDCLTRLGITGRSFPAADSHPAYRQY